MNIEHKVRSFDLKATDDGAGFEGLGAVFHNIDGVGDIIAPGAFADELPQFLQSGFIGGLNHNWESPVGHPIDAKELPDGLYIKAIFDDSDDARNVRAKMVPSPVSGRATIRQLSIGYQEKDAQFLKSHDEVKAYWLGKGYEPSPEDLRALESRKTVRLLKKVSLYEVSPVTRAANSRAAIFSAKNRPAPSRDFAEHSREVASVLGEALSAVEVFTERFERRLAARFKEGRELSQANWAAFRDIHDAHTALGGQHSALSERMASILERTKPKAKPEEGQVTPQEPGNVEVIDHTKMQAEIELRHRHLQLQAMLSGMVHGS